MINKKRRTALLLTTLVGIMLGVSLLIGGTYALFSAKASISNHLKAGNLNVSLLRTSYTKTYISSNGYLSTKTDNTETDFTGTTGQNVFGIESGEVIVPTSSYIANMKLMNGKKNGSTYVKSSVAFTYNVKLSVGSGSDAALTEQLDVTIKQGSSTVSKKLSEFGTESTLFSGTMNLTESYKEFSVSLTFADLKTNNSAQNAEANFDLIVEAVQATA